MAEYGEYGNFSLLDEKEKVGIKVATFNILDLIIEIVSYQKWSCREGNGHQWQT
jgi:hypothetical protein